ncbi:hypothetical protein TOTORO_00940 [Serratia phage vB_SmaS-Totoro]|nr:hypothetical protein TOTORO_00940 [Serratia phage vB_SmaS-Totoro]
MFENFKLLLAIVGMIMLYKSFPAVQAWFHYLFVSLPKHMFAMRRIDARFRKDMENIKRSMFWQLSDITDIFQESYDSHNIRLTFEEYCKRIHSHLPEVKITQSPGEVTLRLYELEQTLATPFIYQ